MEIINHAGLGLIIVLVAWSVKTQLMNRLCRMERKLDLMIQHLGIDTMKDINLSDRVKELARVPGQKIQAIRAHREETGCDLKTAKETVERFTDNI